MAAEKSRHEVVPEAGMPNNAALVAKQQISTRGFVAGACALTLALSTPHAAAEPVSATPKGITGGALLGAEVVVFTEAAIGLDSPWLYLVGATVGAGGGATGGYYVEQTGDAKLSLYMLLGGMALIIPASITYLNATAYDPAELDPSEETAPPIAAHWQHTAPPATQASLVRFDANQWSVHVPNVVVDDVHSQRERAEFGLPQQTRVSVSLVSGNF